MVKACELAISSFLLFVVDCESVQLLV